MTTCTPAVTFNYTNWVARYPEFTNVSSGTAQLYFQEATIYCANRLGPVCDLGFLTMLLNMLTAFIASIYSLPDGTPAPANAPPGRISNATEGSVSVGFALDLPPSAAFFSQNKYGVAFWQATAPFRTMHYRVAGGYGVGQPSWQYPNNS